MADLCNSSGKSTSQLFLALHTKLALKTDIDIYYKQGNNLVTTCFRAELRIHLSNEKTFACSYVAVVRNYGKGTTEQ